jgi:hypothetical protein
MRSRTASATSFPNPANNSTYGTLELRRTCTNNSGAPVTRFRFRVIDLSTFPGGGGVADLRVLTSLAGPVTVDRAPCGSGFADITVRGTTLEQPPAQVYDGGFNFSLDVALPSPLAAGDSVDLRFLFGVEQTGTFKFQFNIEALP